MALVRPKSLLLLIVAIGLSALVPVHDARAEDAPTSQPTVVIVVRHAEKSSDASRDPSLSPVGQERARKLGSMLRDVGIKAVYVSDTRRAKETAEPITDSLGLVADVYPGREVVPLIEQVLKNSAGQTVLVVGHSNTVPEMISVLTSGRESVVLRDDEYDAMFIVTIGRHAASSLLRLRY
jgi:2,3-bisphosphoglycerate-dependent phosphoglycerate mutase